MHAGNRLKLFRILYGYTQQELASAGNITQRSYGQLENKPKIGNNYIDIYSEVFGLSADYLGTGNTDTIFSNHIGIFHVPPKRFDKYRDDRSVFVRKINEFQNFCDEYLPSFFSEVKAKNYYILNNNKTGYMLYVLPLVYDQLICICSERKYCQILNKSIEPVLNKADKVDIDTDLDISSTDPEIVEIAVSYFDGLCKGCVHGPVCNKFKDEDVLVSPSALVVCNLSLEENNLIKYIRENSIPPHKAIDCLKANALT